MKKGTLLIKGECSLNWDGETPSLDPSLREGTMICDVKPGLDMNNLLLLHIKEVLSLRERI
jgi:hypothetical protein